MSQALFIVEMLLEAVAQRHLDRVARNYPTLTPEQVQSIGNADPMGGGAVDWIARQVSRGNLVMPEDEQKTTELLDRFSRIKDNPAFTGERNLYAYRQFQDLFHALLRAPKPKAKVREQRRIKGDVILKRHGNLTLHQVKTYEASRHLGAGTAWCIRFPDAYHSYATKGPIYIVTQDDQPYIALVPDARQIKDIADHNPAEADIRKVMAIPTVKDIVKEHALARGIRTLKDVEQAVEQGKAKQVDNFRAAREYFFRRKRKEGVPEDQIVRTWNVYEPQMALIDDFHLTGRTPEAYATAIRLALEA
jgi:hypothetical protein